MFNFGDNDLLIDDNEVKPNTYIAKALLVGIIALVVCLIFNETGIFRIDKVLMRISCGIALFFCVLPQILGHNKKIVRQKWCKYVMLFCVFGLTSVLGLCMFIFVAPLCLLPLLLAVQYNSRKFSRIAIVGTCLIVIITTPLGCLTGLWQSDFLDFLLRYSLRSYIEFNREALVAQGRPLSDWEIIGNISLYISLPWLMCVLLASRLIQSIAKKNEEGIKAQLEIRRLSKVDSLTGLYNQNIYKEYIKQSFDYSSIGVLFFDVDGLKKVNDEYGHDYGDMLLKNCAKSLRSIFDENCCGFRVGGDEFLVLVDTENPEDLDRKIEVWRAAIKAIQEDRACGCDHITYHMSVGSAFGKKRFIEAVVAEADQNMYREKNFYKQSKMN